MKRTYLLLLLAICSAALFGQTPASYGVSATLQTLPPFTPNVADWADPLNNKIGLTLLLNDRNEPGYQVQLRMRIEGQGISLVTRQDWVPSSIALSYGMPVQLTSIDLAEYFDLDHLQFNGYSRDEYFKQGGLPEGTYTICFETYDQLRLDEGPSSLPACSFIQARLLDPPVILAPIADQVALTPQQLLVQWQARHSASFMTDYKVEIYELVEGLTPEQIYSVQQPFIETEVSGMTSVVIDASFPLLKKGTSYFARVKASAPMDAAFFKNGGFSELSVFTYGSDCPAPTGLNIEVVSFREAKLSWDLNPGSNVSYVVRYREKNKDANWYEEVSNLLTLSLSALNDETIYEVQVQSVCDGTPGPFGPSFEFETPERPFDPNNVQCGDEIADLPLPENTTPIADLQFNDRIEVGQFDLKITEASDNGNGTWAGKGEMRIPWLGVLIDCSFEDLAVNTDGAAIGGEVIADDKGLASVDGLMTVEEITAARAGGGTFCGEEATNPPSTPESETSPSESEAAEGLAEASNEEEASGSLPFVMGEGNQQLIFHNMKFGPTSATLSAYSVAKLPIGDQHVAFAAEDFGMQPGGMQGSVNLTLASGLNFDWNSKMRFTLADTEKTFISFDCEGINEVGLQLDIEFCRELLVPIDPATATAAEDGFVTATFIGVAPAWEEIAADVSISPFELPSLPGWTFTVDNAILDLADVATPSDVVFPEEYRHPEVTTGGSGEGSPAWKGFYIGKAQVTVPKQFTEEAEGGAGVTLGVEHLIVDETGFSGKIFGEDILSLEQGRVGGWALSMDKVNIEVLSDQFSAANLEGEVDVPALDDPLAYACTIQDDGSYAFSVTVDEESEISMSALGATLNLTANSEFGIEFDAEEDDFVAYAKLFGTATFDPSLDAGDSPENTTNEKSGTLNIPQVAFEDFHLLSKEPYIENIGSWALSSAEEGQPLVGGFPLQINELSMLHDKDNEQVAFGIDLTLNLVGEDDKGFGADGRAFIICDVTVDENTGKQDWSFNRVRMDKLALDYVGSGFEMHGFVEQFTDDETFGTGFSGGIQASFKPGLSVGAVALFGQKDDFRYFFADALAGFETGIPVGTTGMAIYGFGGGVSYHMERQGFAGLELPVSNATEAAPAEEADAGADAGAEEGDESNVSLADALNGPDPADKLPPPVDLPGELGKSLSGVQYIPNKDVGIGIKAMVAFGTTKREVFNGDITFEVQFNDDGGMRQIGLSGNANFLTPPKTAAALNPSPAISAFVDMTYDFNNEAFDAYLRLKLFLAKGVVRGAYPDFVAGEGKIHADANDWYIHLGTPTQPIKLSYDLSALANIGGDDDTPATIEDNPLQNPSDSEQGADAPLGSVGDVGLLLTAYLDAGTILPDFPDPPQEVMNLLNDSGDDFNPTKRDDPAFASAEGLLFGAGFEVSMPDLKFLIFYANINAGLGFDMMLKNYGEKAICGNMPDSPDPIGINGWYATGQFYGYLEAGLGVEVDLLGFQGKYPIFDVSAAALMQARMPNPMWMRGQIAGEYDILGGLVSGRCEFEFEAGTQCEISEGSILTISLIESITPAADEQEVNVFTNPQAVFNYPIDQTFVMEDPDGNYLELKPTLRGFVITDEESGDVVEGEIIWNEEKNTVAYRPTDILVGKQAYKLGVTVDMLQFTNGNWVPAIVKGERITQTEEISFVTGDAPEEILESNVSYAYPINRQLNFHRKEAGKGYIKLAQGQDYLFIDQPGAQLNAADWSQEIRFHQGDKVVAVQSFEYNPTDNQLDFELPGNQLSDNTITFLEVVNVPTKAIGDVDANIREVERDVAQNLPKGSTFANNATTVLVRSREAKGNLSALQEKQIYRLDFRTSQFPTFIEKAASMVKQRDFISIQALTTPVTTTLADGTSFRGTYLSIDDFGEVMLPGEAMDAFELAGQYAGAKNIGPLIKGEANLEVTGGNWYNLHPKPNVYDLFPQPANGLQLSWRDTSLLGEPPVRAIKIRQGGNKELLMLSDFEVTNNTLLPTSTAPVVLNYHLPYVMYRDFANYRNQVSNFSVSNELSPELDRFHDWKFIWPSSGNYEVRLQYFLPGKTTPNAQFTTQINYNGSETKK